MTTLHAFAIAAVLKLYHLTNDKLLTPECYIKPYRIQYSWRNGDHQLTLNVWEEEQVFAYNDWERDISDTFDFSEAKEKMYILREFYKDES